MYSHGKSGYKGIYSLYFSDIWVLFDVYFVTHMQGWDSNSKWDVAKMILGVKHSVLRLMDLGDGMMLLGDVILFFLSYDTLRC